MTAPQIYYEIRHMADEVGTLLNTCNVLIDEAAYLAIPAGDRTAARLTHAYRQLTRIAVQLLNASQPLTAEAEDTTIRRDFTTLQKRMEKEGILIPAEPVRKGRKKPRNNGFISENITLQK